ncbi:GtrA family protein [Solilutibacter silvestris]|uniref:GtrA-like protein n=1 Tax=Solilutibacter silvestris TaxID=1645665 RepID=A0A2K1Q1T8_9GAMM|nr:GtrA family protein [Lysobacter silvestris]PNS09008.1 GtrA-like protein [Lysobacter silvestris]
MSFKRHVGAYTAIGAVQWVVDYLVTVALSSWLMPLELANICGQLSGALLGYWLNGLWTFADHQRGLSHAAMTRFILSWVLTTLGDTWAVGFVGHQYGLHVAWAWKPAIDFVFGTIGFFVSRHWVYNRRHPRPIGIASDIE